MVAGSTSETEIIESHRFSFFGVWGDGLPRFDGPVLTTGAGDARRLCALDTNLLQCPNSPGTEELPR
jgi:hypothetical protein